MARRSNIKVDRSTFEELQDAKPDGVSWDHYLRDHCLDDTDASLADILVAIDELPERTANELDERFQR